MIEQIMHILLDLITASNFLHSIFTTSNMCIHYSIIHSRAIEKEAHFNILLGRYILSTPPTERTGYVPVAV